MLKGDATWATQKVILGWTIDIIDMTVELPAHRIQRLFDIFDFVESHQKRVSVTKWQNILGELRSMTMAIPGDKVLVSLLQEALPTSESDSPALCMRCYMILGGWLQIWKGAPLILWRSSHQVNLPH
jgi:hypothetical protein